MARSDGSRVTLSSKSRTTNLPPLQMGVFEERPSHTPGMHWVSDVMGGCLVYILLYICHSHLPLGITIFALDTRDLPI